MAGYGISIYTADCGDFLFSILLYNTVMLSDLFFTLLYQPLYNGLLFLVSTIPYADFGVAVVVLTVLVKVILFPLTHKSVTTQAAMRKIEPHVRELRETYKDDKQKQSQKIMDLYREHGVNPFAGCLPFLIQIPVVIALYFVFLKGLTDGLQGEHIYSFITVPEHISTMFLGLVDISGKSLLLALAAGVSQYFQVKLATPPLPEKTPTSEPSFKQDFAKSFQLQMRYGLPVLVFFISYSISGVIALYWFVSNLFTIGHELTVRRMARRVVAQD